MSAPFTVMVAVDGSEYSDRAVDFGLDLCLRMEGARQLYVLHAVPLNPPSTFPGMDKVEKSYNIEAKNAAQELKEKYARRLHARVGHQDSLRADMLMMQSDSKQVIDLIAEAVAERRPDMFVIGTRGLTGLKKMVMGSVTEQCIRTLTCPVTVVK
eukprot:Opistho-2@68868